MRESWESVRRGLEVKLGGLRPKSRAEGLEGVVQKTEKVEIKQDGRGR